MKEARCSRKESTRVQSESKEGTDCDRQLGRPVVRQTAYGIQTNTQSHVILDGRIERGRRRVTVNGVCNPVLKHSVVVSPAYSESNRVSTGQEIKRCVVHVVCIMYSLHDESLNLPINRDTIAGTVLNRHALITNFDQYVQSSNYKIP